MAEQRERSKHRGRNPSISRPGRSSRRPDQGQVALETALTLPLFVGAALAVVQLALVQQARVMTEYAAFCAARAGIVWNGSGERMRDAAILTLLPTLGRTRDAQELSLARERFDAEEAARAVRLVTVKVEPSAAREKAGWQELSFDEHRPQWTDSRAGPSVGPPGETLLAVRLRYLYELRVPFADQLIYSAFLGSSQLPADERAALDALATRGRRRFLPLEGRSRLRMQSNLYRRFLEGP
jgi:hypothetical protein